MADPAALVIPSIVERHFEEAVTLWPQRDADVHGTQRTFEELIELDGRVSAHLDGLRIARASGWNESSIESNLSDPGEAFVRVLLALEDRSGEALEQVFDAAAANDVAARGVVSAFGWASADDLRGIVKELLSSSHPFKRRVGIAACAVHRVDPGEPLRQAIVDGDVPLRRRALRAIGELGRTDQEMILRTQHQAEDSGCRFWASWAAVMTGDRAEALKLLASLGIQEPAYRVRAMQVVLRVLTPNRAKDWLRLLRDQDETQRDVLLGAAIAGDPSYVPWLIAQMDVPDNARLAGEAFSTITGVDLHIDQMTRDRPEGFESGPTDEIEDENVAMDPDADLRWPDPQRVRAWWEANGARFLTGERYLGGQPVNAEHCRQLLRQGRQGLRQAAAFELALMEPAAPLFETRAPAFRQQRQLKGS